MRQPRLAPWAALQHRNFALLFTGAVVSAIGSWMQQIVISWHIYLLTDSALSVGLVGLARAIPSIVFSLIGGALADSMDRRKLLIVTQATSMVLSIILAALTSADLIQVWMIYLIAFLTAATSSFDQPARQAIIPSLVPRTHVNNAVNLVLVIRHTGAIIGPAIGGIVLAVYGIAPAYWINAAAFIALIVALLAMRVPPIGAEQRPRVSPQMLIDGGKFVWATPVVLAVLCIDFVVALNGNTRAAWPTFARDVFQAGELGLGWLGASPSVGALLGIGAALALGDVRRKGVGVILCNLGYGLAIFGFGLAPNLLFACIALACYGLVDAIADSMNYTLILLETPDELQGRVSSVVFMLTSAGPSLGQLWIGFLMTAIGARQGVALGAVVVVLFATGLLAFAKPLTRYGALKSVSNHPESEPIESA